ncbi:unnamed protein product [Staurois parvus]|uniref:Uncharacterized protein n=1 Tax=Staurois parvus TaxID=386267 RepID=A0ABN9FPG7_9NEOB|nr:unnamed protein product [Staurois parvus]
MFFKTFSGFWFKKKKKKTPVVIKYHQKKALFVWKKK